MCHLSWLQSSVPTTCIQLADVHPVFSVDVPSATYEPGIFTLQGVTNDVPPSRPSIHGQSYRTLDKAATFSKKECISVPLRIALVVLKMLSGMSHLYVSIGPNKMVITHYDLKNQALINGCCEDP